ncbi:MAG: alginate lyase family protein [Kineosporiaceae bacterium]
MSVQTHRSPSADPSADPAGGPGEHARVVPRAVFCPTRERHRDLGVADDARRGVFTCAGERRDLGDGTDLGAAAGPDRPAVDWHDPRLPDDEEWRIEWSKFGWGLDLAHAFAVTGDEGYLRAWERLVVAWTEQVAVDADPTDVVGRRLQHWVFAWADLEQAAVVGAGRAPSAATRDALLASVAAQVDHLEANAAAERNHRTLELFAVLVVRLALPALDPGGGRALAALAALGRNLLDDVRVDGVQRERSSHYHLVALRSWLAAVVNARRFGLALPTGYLPRLAAACRFGLHLHRPDGRLPALSDADAGSHLDTLALAAEVLDDDTLRWAGTGGRAGTPPRERFVGFDVAGYYVQRSGWATGTDERFLVLGAGPLGDGGHGHYDALSVEAYGRGRPLVVDPGRYTYAENGPGPDPTTGPSWRAWFKGTAAHNTMTVDDLDQTPYRRGKPKGPNASAHLVHRHTDPGTLGPDRLDVLVAEVTSPQYAAVHRRHVLLVHGAYWLVVDEGQDLVPRTYTLRWHLDPSAGPAVLVAGGGAVSAVADGVAIGMVAAPGTVSAAVEPGWVSPEYGVRHAADVVAVRTAPVPRVEIATTLVPRPDPGAPPPRLAAVPGGYAVEVDGGPADVLTRDGDTWTLA